MKLGFRQGLVSFQKNGLNQPTFLLPSMTSGWVAFDVAPLPTIANMAHGASNYIVVFDSDIDAAWGPLVPSVTNYLFWDVDLLTGIVTRGITTLVPVNSLEAPVAPAVGQHWFDLSSTKMRVWSGNKWQDKVRLFAGHVLNGNTAQIVPYLQGSQVGLVEDIDAGYIMLDDNVMPPRPLRNSAGEFLTTTAPVRIQISSGTSGVLAIPPNAFIPIRASESIPRFSIVYFSGEDTVGLASSNPSLPMPKVPVGIVQEDLDTNEVGVLTQYGEVAWDQWPFNLADYIGKPLYCGFNGEFTPVRPNTLMAYRVGFVKNANTVLIQVDAETLPQVYQSEGDDIIIEGAPPLSATYTQPLGERVWTIEMTEASATQDGYATAEQIAQLEGYEVRISDIEAELPNKSDVGHTHVIANVTDLQPALDAIDAALLTKANRTIGNTPNNLASLSVVGDLQDSGYSPADFAPVVHTHSIAQVTALQDALNDKSDVGHTHPIAEVDNLVTVLASKADIGHTHSIANVTGLQDALDDKSDVGHGHVIADTTGLQTALDGKAPVVHAHNISDVNDLQTELDGKAPLVHIHAIADVSGLQDALDDKSDVGHLHAIGDVTGLVTALDSKEPVIPAGTVADYWRGDKTWQTLNKAAVGLGNVDNTSDLDKPISTATQAALDNKSNVGHTHVPADITGGTAGYVLTSNGTTGQWTAPKVPPALFEAVATAGQTIFTTTVATVAKAGGLAYLQVFVNGVLQREGPTGAFEVTGPTEITFAVGLALNDEVTIYSFA